MNKKSIAIDMDGVIADVEQQFFDWYEKDYSEKLSVEELTNFADDDASPLKAAIRKFVFTPGFFLTLPVMPGAVEALKTLSQTYEVYIVSAAMEFPQSLSEKLEWLNINFPFVGWRNIIFCGDKSIINTDYMIDDHIKNLDNFKGKTLMFHAYHNGSYNHHTRYNTWNEILDFFKTEQKNNR